MAHTYILVVDDDEKIIKFLRFNLSGEGWHVLTARDGAEALQIVEKDPPDLVLLDMMLPKVDGFEVCRRLRQWSQVPIIGLSARGDMADKVKCLDLGADDYITKPFGIDELIARIKAVLRRNKIDDSTPARSYFKCGNLKVDFVMSRVTLADSEVKLTPTEYKLLRELVLSAGQTLGYRYLLGKIWGPEYKTEREYLHVYIGHLRAKVQSDPRNPAYILSVPGVGYRFQDVP
ncbi:MAG TPA: response regulator transcription factor [Dehalococcoidales bacterium]|nr:response regulator transcription factor [Dehalococcoidales bacterium]